VLALSRHVTIEPTSGHNRTRDFRKCKHKQVGVNALFKFRAHLTSFLCHVHKKMDTLEFSNENATDAIQNESAL